MNALLVKINYCKLADRKDSFLRYFPEMLAVNRTNDLLAIWSHTTSSCTGSWTVVTSMYSEINFVKKCIVKKILRNIL